MSPDPRSAENEPGRPDAPSPVDELAEAIERQLRAAGSPERAVGEKAYLKSDLDFLGASVPAIRRVVRSIIRGHPELTPDELVRLVCTLWERGIHECRMAAVELLEMHVDRLGAAHLGLLGDLVRSAHTWALVDGLSISVLGVLVDRHPEIADRLDEWAGDEDFWIRRASLLAMLKPLRRGEGDFDRFARYADSMVDDTEFFIRKAIGWVLRETGRARPEQVAGWLSPRIGRLSGVTVREAVKYLPDQSRGVLLDAHREARHRPSRG